MLLKRQKIDKLNPYYYIRVNYTENGVRKIWQQYIHRLVALCFIDNPDNKKEVNHIDGNKLNNNVSNLEWCTRLENMKHATTNNLFPSKAGVKNGRHKLCEDDVIAIRELYNNGMRISDIAKKFHIGWSTTQHIIKKTYLVQYLTYI